MNNNCYFTGYSVVAVNEFGDEVIRTKDKYPYSYDGFVTFRNGDNKEINNTVYSDRLSQWDYKKTNNLMLKHFGDKSDYWYNREPKKVEAFLREWTNCNELKLILIMEYCNVSNGYPLWRFDYFTPQIN